MSSVIEVQVKISRRKFFKALVKHFLQSILNNNLSHQKERLTSHGGGIGLSSGGSAYTGHTTSSGGRSSSLSSSQHGHGPSAHQPADFQPPYFPPPFHHPSTHQSSPQQQQQVRQTQIFVIFFSFNSFLESPRTRLLEPIERSLWSNSTVVGSSSSHFLASPSL